MKKKILTNEEIAEINLDRKRLSEDKFKLGRHVVRTEEWHGLKKNTSGWVISVWPETRVAFEDGFTFDIHWNHSQILKVTDDYVDSLKEIYERTSRKRKKKVKRAGRL